MWEMELFPKQARRCFTKKMDACVCGYEGTIHVLRNSTHMQILRTNEQERGNAADSCRQLVTSAQTIATWYVSIKVERRSTQ